MVWKRLIGTKILEIGEFESYLGGRQGQQRIDSDVKMTGWVVRLHLLSLNLKPPPSKHVINVSTC